MPWYTSIKSYKYLYLFTLLPVLEQVLGSISENKRRNDGGEVLSALGDLLSDQLTCKRCKTTTNQPQSSCPGPSAGQEANQNVPLATIDSTIQAPRANNNAESTAVNGAGELMRLILHDIKKLKTTIIRQRAARDGGEKRHEADVEEFSEQEKERRTRRRASPSDHNDEYELSIGRHLHFDTNHSRLSTTTRDYRMSGGGSAKLGGDDDRKERRTRRKSGYDNLQPRRSSRWNESGQDRRNRSPRVSPPPPRRHHHGPSGQFMTGDRSSREYAYGQFDPHSTLPSYKSYQQLSQHQQHDPQVTQQQFHSQKPPQQMQFYPYQIPQHQQLGGGFRPIQQMSPAQRQPLVFLPIHQQQPPPQDDQLRPEFRPNNVVRHSTEAAAKPSKLSHRQSRRLRDAVKLARETKNLTTQMYKRQKHAIS